MAKKFKKFKRNFKRFSRKRKSKPTGYLYKKSILGMTNRRVIDITVPIFWKGQNTPLGTVPTNTFAAYPSFTIGNQFNVDVLGSLVQTVEHIRMSKTMSLFRVKGAAIKYYNTCQNEGRLQIGTMAFVMQNVIGTNLGNTYFADNALRVQGYSTSPSGSKSKYYKNPMRNQSIKIDRLDPNAWIPTAPTGVDDATGVLYLNMGVPFYDAGNPNGSTLLATDITLIGKVQIKVYCEYSQPIVTN